MTVRTVAVLLLGLLAIGIASPAAAVLISWGTGTGNTDPSVMSVINYVGALNGASGTYLREGWVLTANHVGPGNIEFAGVPYQYIEGTATRLETTPGIYADLVMFKVYPTPMLPPRAIRSTSPEIGDLVVMAGNGRDRGAKTSYDPFGPDVDPTLQKGWLWKSSQCIRWGLNEVVSLGAVPILGTKVFMTQFDNIDPVVYESQASSGDSGGGVFISGQGAELEVAGIMLSVSLEFGQDPASSLFTNQTIIASLDVYADQINDTIAAPEPTGGLAVGLGMLTLMARKRRRESRRAALAGDGG